MTPTPSAGPQSSPTFLPNEQAQWLTAQVTAAKAAGMRIALFSHQQVRVCVTGVP